MHMRGFLLAFGLLGAFEPAAFLVPLCSWLVPPSCVLCSLFFVFCIFDVLFNPWSCLLLSLGVWLSVPPKAARISREVGIEDDRAVFLSCFFYV